MINTNVNKRITITLSKPTEKRLNALAKLMGTKRSNVIEKLIDDFIREELDIK